MQHKDKDKIVDAYEISENVIGLHGKWFRIKEVDVEFKYESGFASIQERKVHEALAVVEALEETGVLVRGKDYDVPGCLSVPGFLSAKVMLVGLAEIELPPQTVLIPVKTNESTLKMQS